MQALTLTATSSQHRGPSRSFNPPAGLLKDRENNGVWHDKWILDQAKMDSVYKKKSLEQQINKLAQQVTEALKGIGVNKQSTQVKVFLMDSVRKSSDAALDKNWPAAVHLRGFEKNMPVKSRASANSELERGLIVRVKANGNYDIEKRVEDLCPARVAAVRKQIDRTGIRITVVTDSNVPPMDIVELPGARFNAFNIVEEPEWELAVLSQCRQFNLKEVAKLLGTEVPKPVTYGLNRTGLY